MSNNI